MSQGLKFRTAIQASAPKPLQIPGTINAYTALMAERVGHQAIYLSGGGVAKHSPNRENAVAFLEFLTGSLAQQLYGEVNFEYPVNRSVAPGGVLQSFGEFKPDALPIERLAELAPQAQMIIDRTGW